MPLVGLIAWFGGHSIGADVLRAALFVVAQRAGLQRYFPFSSVPMTGV
jgi:hypothetical protein